MKNNYSRLLILGVITFSIFLCLPLTSTSRESNKPDSMAELYKQLYFSHLAADLGLNTAVLTRMDQGDYKTAKNVMLLRLKTDLDRMNSETNYPWSEQEKKAKTLAEQYLSQSGKK
jgi:hypothetical protein